jgi:hypothetical protein
MATAHQQFMEQWMADMRSDAAPGGKVDVGPAEALASKAGRAHPKRDKKAGRVPPPSAGQTRKGGPPS